MNNLKCLHYQNHLFQASDEKIEIEMILIREADIKVDSEEFCDANDGQANCDGMREIIICSSTVLMLYNIHFIVAFIFCFMDIF